MRFIGPLPPDCSDLGTSVKAEVVFPLKAVREKEEEKCPLCGSPLVVSTSGEVVCPNCGYVAREALSVEFTGEAEIGGENFGADKADRFVSFEHTDKDLFIVASVALEQAQRTDYSLMIQVKEAVARALPKLLALWAERGGCSIGGLYVALAYALYEHYARSPSEHDRKLIRKKLTRVRPWELRFLCQSSVKGEEECLDIVREVLFKE